MKKSFWVLYLGMLMLGVVQGEAGWVYLEDDEIASADEIELSETLGRIEGDQEEEGLTLNEEALLPWGIDESSHEEFSTFVEEHAKQANREYEESFALDSSSDDLEEEDFLPSMEKVPTRGTGVVAGRPKVMESPRRRSEISESPKMQLQREPLAPKKRVEKRHAAKKSAKIAQAPVRKKTETLAKQSPHKLAKKSTVTKERKTPSKQKEIVQRKKQQQLHQKKATAATPRSKHQRSKGVSRN